MFKFYFLDSSNFSKIKRNGFVFRFMFLFRIDNCYPHFPEAELSTLYLIEYVIILHVLSLFLIFRPATQS